jgi:COP9 signalosome complex subunit 7
MSVQEYCEKASGKSAAVVATVLRQALTANSLYFYSPLFHLPDVQKLEAEPQYAPIMNAMKLIMYGTYGDLSKQTAEVKDIFSSSQTLLGKLRQLTLVSLACKSRRLPYKDIQDALGISDTREMEDLVIDSITEGLLQGRLDQMQRVVEIHESVARDVNLDQLDGMIDTLEAWVGRCDNVIAELQKSQKLTNEEIKKEAAKAKKMAEDEANVLERCKALEIERAEQMEELSRRGGPSARVSSGGAGTRVEISARGAAAAGRRF